MSLVDPQSFGRQLETIHRITSELNMTTKARLVSLILYANAFDQVTDVDFPELALVCINLACKIEETCYRLEKVVEHFKMHFANFSVKKENITRMEMEIIKHINFDLDIVPLVFAYLRLLRTCKAQEQYSKKLQMIESIHLDTRILKIRYFDRGEFSPSDVALSVMDDRHINEIAQTHRLFVDFGLIDRIRCALFGA